ETLSARICIFIHPHMNSFTDTTTVRSRMLRTAVFRLSGSGLDDWRRGIPNPAAKVGQRRHSNHLYGSAENSMTLTRRNRRGIFGNAVLCCTELCTKVVSFTPGFSPVSGN